MSFPFNIRVYGILIRKGKVLLSSETYAGRSFAKFPGGGLEFGEGLRDCLKREFKEETGFEIEVGVHFYTTDFFQQSAFNPNHQLISVYYFVDWVEPDQISDAIDSLETGKRFFWKKRNELTANDVTFPVDKEVCRMLKKSNR